MKLLLDVGNSRCKCAVYSNGDLHHYPPVVVNADDSGACVPGQMVEQAGDAVTAIAVASVRADEFNRRLCDALSERFNVQPVPAVTGRAACGVTTAYRNAASLGVDRFLALVGAWRRVGGACVVADCGTAATIDAINDNGVHQGGLIMPGLCLLRDSLSGSADRLPVPGDAGDQAAVALFARDTGDAIASGCRRMFTGAVITAMREMQAQLSGGAALLATGGDGEALLEVGGAAVRYYPHLVIEGLAAFSERGTDCG